MSSGSLYLFSFLFVFLFVYAYCSKFFGYLKNVLGAEPLITALSFLSEIITDVGIVVTEPSVPCEPNLGSLHDSASPLENLGPGFGERLTLGSTLSMA